MSIGHTNSEVVVESGDGTQTDGRSIPVHGSAEEFVYDALSSAIRSGDLQPGQHITETEIARWCKVSRTPVRAAVKLLEDQRLITRIPGIGLTVTELSVEQLDDIYSTRSVLMGLAARLAAQRMTARDWLKLQALQDEMESLELADNAAELVTVNDAFHDHIVHGSRSESLSTILSQIHLSIVRYRHSTHLVPGRTAEAMKEHRELLAAFIARDEEKAEAIGRAHVVNAHLARVRQQAQLEVERVRQRSGA